MTEIRIFSFNCGGDHGDDDGYSGIGNTPSTSTASTSDFDTAQTAEWADGDDDDLRSEMIHAASSPSDPQTADFSREVSAYLLKTRSASAYKTKDAALAFCPTADCGYNSDKASKTT